MFAKKILEARKELIKNLGPLALRKAAEEGGCGVVGFAASVPVRGRHIFEPSIQMHNRGNGKGGGIAAAALDPAQLGVDASTLKNDYLLQVALLDPAAKDEIERDAITPDFEINHSGKVETVDDPADVGLEVKPPDIVRYFVRAKKGALERFAAEHRLEEFSEREVEDELIYRNSFKLNQTYYASLGDKRAFVMSHARDLMIFKIVGYAEQVVQYYRLEDLTAKVWIAHQRYPTKGRVWHPAGSHPFIGLNEALVHNGDFANYFAVSEYLSQHNIRPQFLTDTEVSVLLFDLWSRIYKYPLEYVIEAMAPTTELDFDQLAEDRRKVYRAIQTVHTSGSPDGPWFFIIAQSKPDENIHRLLGITDTAMLRPQVFAIQEGDVSIGLVASEKQAIDATLKSLNQEDPRFRLVADRYWNARGGSHTDGGAFSFTLSGENGATRLECADKFGRTITAPPGEYKIELHSTEPGDGEKLAAAIESRLETGDLAGAFQETAAAIGKIAPPALPWLIDRIAALAEKGDDQKERSIELLTFLNDLRFDCGAIRRSSLIQVVRQAIDKILQATPAIDSGADSRLKSIGLANKENLRPPQGRETTLVVDADGFPPEGDDCDAMLLVNAFKKGWKRFIVYRLRGQRFHGCGMGPKTDGARLDLYGSSGDYMASGIDGLEIRVHDNGQDQLGQIMKRGKLVVYGDVGQAFMYGAKGGEVYIMGNGAGRPLINAVGRPKVVINGTCLDFLAESFMAGDPHKGGGFVILNGIGFDDQGKVVEQPTPYPGSNLFSLASGGAIFARDPHKKLVREQLNGGDFAEVTDKDWKLILPFLKENERLFGISVERDLLTVDGELKTPAEVYRKVHAVKLAVLAKMQVPE